MSLIRPSRVAAAFVMLIGMLMMQISIAACRCIEVPASTHAMATVGHHDAGSAPADRLLTLVGGQQAHALQDDRDHTSCDDCIEYLERAKRLSDGTDHPRVAPFTPSALHLVLDKASAVTLAPVRPDSSCDRRAGTPQLHIQHCSYQL